MALFLLLNILKIKNVTAKKVSCIFSVHIACFVACVSLVVLHVFCGLGLNARMRQ